MMYSSPLSYKKTEISVFNFTFAHNHTPVTLLCQAHIAMAAMGGGIPARFGSSDDLLGLLRTSHLRCNRPELSTPLRSGPRFQDLLRGMNFPE